MSKDLDVLGGWVWTNYEHCCSGLDGPEELLVGDLDGQEQGLDEPGAGV
jgi:hypothetical protein